MKVPKTNAHVLSLTPLTQHVVQIILQPETYISYQTGQYLLLNELAFSIANAACLQQPYEIHFRHYADNTLHQTLLTQLEQKISVTLELPFGDCTYEHIQSDNPLILIAGGTGFAQLKAIIEQAIYEKTPRTIALYWMVRSPGDDYMAEYLKSWSKQLAAFQYEIIYTNNQPFSVKTIKSILNLKNSQIVLSGPFEMVYHVRDQLLHQGVSREQLFSDAFAFED